MNFLLNSVYSALLLSMGTAIAATTDISNTPLANTGPLQAKPNIMLIIDDSGSMDWEYLPDSSSDNSRDCYYNSSFNKIYFDPNKTYTPPIKYDGTSYPNASFTAAKNNGYTGTSTTNLTNNIYTKIKTTSNVAPGVCGNEAASAYCSNSNYSTQATCEAKKKGKPNGTWFPATAGDYDTITLTASSTESQNYANWYSYYRKRVYTARAAAGFAFQSLTDKYRVGFNTTSNTSPSNSSRFMSIADFNSTQKQSFYDKLYSVPSDQWTPLRQALSWTGRYFADKISNQEDPIQYSCQKNFSILTTDGYWNQQGGSKLDGSAMGNEDGGTTARPYLDSLNKSDTLADTAMYYYNTDLRTSALGNCTGALGGSENVCTDALDSAHEIQRMTTYTLGLGLNGTLTYVKNYDSPAQGDYLQILQGTKNWPDPIANTDAERIDDLWHAAVNGHGKYYSADNATDMAESLSDALTQIQAHTGSSSAAATSNLEPVAGDNFVYVALYRTGDWYGDLLASTIDVSTGAVSLKLDATNGDPVSGTYTWSAQTQLDTKAGATTDSRNIYLFNSNANTKLTSFTYSNLTSTQKGYFDNLCSGTVKLSQCSSLVTADKTNANLGTNVVNYLRGQNQYENTLFRDRTHLLGDIVNATPIYVKSAPFQYTDNDYSSFITAQKDRAATVYAAANDGMLHAFDGVTGNEIWAYIPSMVLSNLYKLADNDYANMHQYYVDASPTVADVYVPTGNGNNSAWKTILVGGLNAGGKGLYAIDVTDPSNPKGLWEFTDTDMGYTFGNPVVTRLATGEWVVLVSSGLNNVANGDGIGRLYVLNAADGSIKYKISTGVGDTTTPSGLGKLNAWIENPLENKVDRVYGGDMLGNVWRFDVNDTIANSGREAVKIAELNSNSAGTIKQPITTKPELAKINNKFIVLVGTGRYLGSTDVNDTRVNSVYAFKDSSLSTGLGNLRAITGSNAMVRQTLVDGVDANSKPIRTISHNAVDWSTNSGWYVDLISSGERVNVDMQLQYNTLTFAGNVPGNSNACTVSGGFAWLYHVDINDGSYLATVSNATQAGQRLDTNALVAGIKTIKLPTGRTVSIVTDTGGTIKAYDDPTPTGSAAGTAKRTSWRELID